MTQTPGAPSLDGQPQPSAEFTVDLGGLAPVLAEALHQSVHCLAQIAAELRQIREAINRQEEIFGAFQRGGKLAAGVAARRVNRERNGKT